MTREEYFAELKRILAIHGDTHGIFLAWAAAESGTEPCDGFRGAKWNPLNTTWNEPGAWDFNSVHVKNYPTAGEGLYATAATLRLPYYAHILAAMREGKSIGFIANLIAQSPWGTGHAIWAGVRAYESSPRLYGSIPVG